MKLGSRPFRAIVRKELLDLRKNKAIVAGMAALPLLVVTVAILTMAALPHADVDIRGADAERWRGFVTSEIAALGPRRGFLVALVDQWLLYLLLLPIALPTAIATHSVVAEKQLRSLEPLLATPITTLDLLAGKTFAAVLFPVLLSWASYAAIAVGAATLAGGDALPFVLRPAWPIAMALVAPALGVLSTLAGVIASSRFQDARAAQSVSLVFVLPLLGVSSTVMLGKVFVATHYVVAAGAVLVVLAWGLLRLAVRVFDRETILTKWK